MRQVNQKQRAINLRKCDHICKWEIVRGEYCFVEHHQENCTRISRYNGTCSKILPGTNSIYKNNIICFITYSTSLSNSVCSMNIMKFLMYLGMKMSNSSMDNSYTLYSNIQKKYFCCQSIIRSKDTCLIILFYIYVSNLRIHVIFFYLLFI